MSHPGSQHLPPVGQEIPCKCIAVGTRWYVDGVRVTLDFEGGIRVRVEENIDTGLGGVRLKVLDHQLEANSEILGRVMLYQSDVDVTPLSLLEIVENSPVFRQTLFLDFRVIMDKPLSGDGPLVLSNTRTAKLISPRMANFPPDGDMYDLQEPVDLAPVGKPDQFFAQLQHVRVMLLHNP